MQQHFVCAEILRNHVVGIDGDYGQTQEQMKVVGEIVGPTCLPHSYGHRFGELALETPGTKPVT